MLHYKYIVCLVFNSLLLFNNKTTSDVSQLPGTITHIYVEECGVRSG
jgi:hypothetical protein